MENIVQNENDSILGDGISNTTVAMEIDGDNFRTIAMSYLMYKIGRYRMLLILLMSSVPIYTLSRKQVFYLVSFYFRSCYKSGFVFLFLFLLELLETCSHS